MNNDRFEMILDLLNEFASTGLEQTRATLDTLRAQSPQEYNDALEYLYCVHNDV